MKLSHEDTVTRMLSRGEILDITQDEEHYMFTTNPLYDLTHYLKTNKPELSRWGEKYVFVK